MRFKDTFENSILSEAAYADFWDEERMQVITDPVLVKTALKAEGFSPIQAADFVNQWRVVDHLPDRTSGFSATLFERIDAAGNGTGEYVFANRGTAGFFSDILSADVFGIVLQGKAAWQLTDMYRYFRRLETPAGEAVAYTQDEIALLNDIAGIPSLDLIALQTGLTSDRGIGVLDNGSKVVVTGHSLGGHLATWFPAFFGSRAKHVYTYNGAGIGGFGTEMLDLLTQAFRDGRMFTLQSEQITNIYGEGGLEVTAGVGTYAGGLQPVFIEDQGAIGGNLLIKNHSIALLTDALAVYGLFDGLDPGHSVAELSSVLGAASNHPKQTLETMVNAMGALLGAGAQVIFTDVREDLYQRIHAIRQILYADPDAPSLILKPQYQGLHLVPLSGKSVGELNALAHTDIATRYALVHGNPFAVTGLDYSVHNANHALDLYDPATDLGLTETYLADRAQYLALKNTLFMEDVTEKTTGFPAAPTVFRDLVIGAELKNFIPIVANTPYTLYTFGSPASDSIQGSANADHLYGGVGADRIQAGDGVDYIEGGAGGDILTGGSGADTLRGGTGNDTLVGGELREDGSVTDDGASDTLHGGAGLDAYYIGQGDTISDSDGRGLLLYKGRLLSGGALIGGTANTYRDASGTRYILDTVTASLSIELPGTATPVTVEGYTGGSLGIRLDNTPGPDLIGSAGADHYAITATGRTVTITAGSLPGHPGASQVHLPRSVTRIEGRGGADRIAVEDDLPGLAVYGNAEDPFAADDKANDIIRVDETGVASGIALADTGNGARLYGQGGNDAIEGGRRDDYLGGGSGGDILEGRGGADILQGGSGDDLLFGGAGTDVLYGGDHNDVLYGDIRYAATIAPDPVTWSGPQNGWQGGGYHSDPRRNFLTPLISGAYTLMPEAGGAEAGADLLFGGAGDDYLIGGGGDDVLDGGRGRDLLEGEGGDDSLAGGEGDDILYGDIAPASATAGQAIFASGTAAIDGLPWSYRLRDYPDGPDAFGNDQLAGGAGADRLFGGAGNDRLDGGTGNDILSGGSGSDGYYFSRGWGTDVIDELSGAHDAIELGDGIGITDIHLRAVGDDLHLSLDDLFGNPGKDLLILRNWYVGDAIERIRFADGHDWDAATIEQLTGQRRRPGSPGAPVDAIGLGGAGNDVLQGGPGADALYGLDGDDSLTGAAGADSLLGGPGDDVLSGGAGNDHLSGGPGRDRLDGGAGSDYYSYAPGDGEDSITDTAGANDRIGLEAGITPAEFIIGRGGDDLLLTRIEGGLPGRDSLRITGGFGSGDTIEAVDFADGTSWGRAALTAGISHYELYDGDTIGGGAGDSLYTLDPDLAAGFTLTISDAGGRDTLWLPNHDRFIPALHVNATRHTEILGSPRRDGNDIVLDLSYWGDGPTVTGSLRLVGQYADNGTIDYLYSAKVTYATRAAAIAHPGRYTNNWGDGWDWQQWRGGAAAFRAVLLSGGPGDDTLKADAPVDTELYGNAGDDTLSGNSRNDILDGGPGSDVLQGGAGNDVYVIDPGGSDRILDDARGQSGFTQDSLRLPSGTDLAGLDLRRQGNDLWLGDNRIENQFLFSPEPHHDETPFAIEDLDDGDWRSRSFSLNLPTYLQGLGLSAQVSGDPGDNTLAGDAASNHIDGLGGNDSLYGLEGDDILEGGAGDDTLHGGGSQYRWWAFDGNDTLLGGAGNDSLYGGSGDDILDGGPGADEFWGGPGNDELHGGGGRGDRFHFGFGDGQDRIVNDGGGTLVLGEGIDEIANLRFQYTATDLILRLVRDGAYTGDQITLEGGLTGPVRFIETIPPPGMYNSPIVLPVPNSRAPLVPITGSAGADTLRGTADHDILIGAGGDDRLDGGAGNDRMRGDAGRDVLLGGAGGDILEGGAGADRIDAGAGDDVIQLGGDGSWRYGYAFNAGSPDHGTWLDYRHRRRGFSLRGYRRNNDVIDGGPGQDLVQGTDGNDAIFLDDGIGPRPAGTRGPRLKGVEQFLMGAGDDLVDLTSRRYAYGDVRLDGGAGDDRLWASSGNDTLAGGPGDDELYGGTGADRYLFGRGDGHDTVIDPLADSGDRLVFGAGIGKEDLWFEKALDSLRIHVLDGRDDGVAVANWHDGQSKPLQAIELSDGQVLLETQLARMIQAMAAFDAPGAFDTGLRPDVRQQLEPVLAEVWQTPAGQV